MKLIYINANLVYGECLKFISSRKIKTGILDLLRKQDYLFITSILTKMEVMQRLIREEQLSVFKARKTYEFIIRKYEMQEISSLNKKNLLTNTFIDVVIKSNLDFKDALHLEIASKRKLLVVTHDKKFIKNASKHEDKQKFYSKVCKPEDLLNN